MTEPVRRDRDGSVIGEDVADPTEVEHRCQRGWLTGPDADEPRPCPRCRPWLAARPPRPPTADELADLAERHAARRRPTGRAS